MLGFGVLSQSGVVLMPSLSNLSVLPVLPTLSVTSILLSPLPSITGFCFKDSEFFRLKCTLDEYWLFNRDEVSIDSSATTCI